MMNSLRDDITTIVECIRRGDNGYWRDGDGWSAELDVEAVVNDIMAAVNEHDGEVLEVFGDA